MTCDVGWMMPRHFQSFGRFRTEKSLETKVHHIVYIRNNVVDLNQQGHSGVQY